MKSDRALSNYTVQRDTYCRHGFHEWVEYEEIQHDSKGSQKRKIVKCKYCGKIKPQ